MALLQVLLGTVSITMIQDTMSVDEVCRKVLENRDRIEGGEFHFVSQYTAAPVSTVTKNIDIYINKNNERMDIRSSDFKATTSFNDKTHIGYIDEPKEPDFLGQATIIPYDKETREALRAKPSNKVVDPRLLGIYPQDCYSLVNANLADFLDRSDRVAASESVAMVESGGRRLLDVRYATKSGLELKMRIDPQKDYNPIRVERNFKESSSGTQYSDVLDVDLKYVEGAKMWFPSTCDFLRTVNGRESVKERLTVMAARINQSVDPGRFELPGLELPPGTVVHDLTLEPDEFMRVWNGTDVERRTRPPVDIAKQRGLDKLGANVWFLIPAVAFAFIAVVAIWYARRAKMV